MSNNEIAGSLKMDIYSRIFCSTNELHQCRKRLQLWAQKTEQLRCFWSEFLIYATGSSAYYQKIKLGVTHNASVTDYVLKKRNQVLCCQGVVKVNTTDLFRFGGRKNTCFADKRSSSVVKNKTKLKKRPFRVGQTCLVIHFKNKHISKPNLSLPEGSASCLIKPYWKCY